MEQMREQLAKMEAEDREEMERRSEERARVAVACWPSCLTMADRELLRSMGIRLA